MPPLPEAAFARALRSLDDEELAAFVAELWAARGYETTVEDTIVLAERPDGRGRARLAVGGSPADTTVDVVIDASADGPPQPEAASRVLGPAELRRMLLFAVDRETGEALAQAHLGRSLVVEDADTQTAGLGALPARSMALVALLVVVAAVTVAGWPGGDIPFEDGSGSVPTATVPPTATPTPAPFEATRVPLVQAGPDRSPGQREAVQYPPGLEQSGVTSVETLAAAHRSRLADTTWTLRLDHDGSLDLLHPERRWATAEQTVVRESPSRYRFDVVGVAELPGGSLSTITYVDYGDGAVNYRRVLGPTSNAFSRTQLPAAGESGAFAAVSAAYVQRYLSTTETGVHRFTIEGRERFMVVATGTPTELDRSVAGYRAIAVLDPRGVVRRLVVEYRPLDEGSETPTGTDRVRFQLVLSDLGSAELTVPSWYEQAVNVTAGSSLPPWPNDPAL